MEILGKLQAKKPTNEGNQVMLNGTCIVQASTGQRKIVWIVDLDRNPLWPFDTVLLLLTETCDIHQEIGNRAHIS